MRKQAKGTSLAALVLIAGLCLLSLSGCSIFRATGEGVQAVGQGVGTAVSGTGRAIMHGANDTQDEISR